MTAANWMPRSKRDVCLVALGQVVDREDAVQAEGVGRRGVVRVGDAAFPMVGGKIGPVMDAEVVALPGAAPPR